MIPLKAHDDSRLASVLKGAELRAASLDREWQVHLGQEGERRMTGTNLFAFAGIVLEVQAKPPRAKKPRPLSAAERAAAGRFEGARRLRSAPRGWIGLPRHSGPGEVVAFPLARNAAAVAEMISRLPHGYAADLDLRRNKEVATLQKSLIAKGIPKQSAWLCARELVHVAYIQCVREAHMEAGIL